MAESKALTGGFGDAVDQFFEYLDEFDEANTDTCETSDFPAFLSEGESDEGSGKATKSSGQYNKFDFTDEDVARSHLPTSLSSCTPIVKFGTETCVLVTILLYALFANIELLTGDGKLGAFQVHPHPYWLIILPMAAASGLGAGLVAAVIGTGLYIYGAYLELGKVGLLDASDASWLVEPGLFMVAALIVGALRSWALLRHQWLWWRYEEISNRNLRLSAKLEHHTATSRELRAKLVEHSSQFRTLIDTATKIETATYDELLELALDLVQEHCGASMCSVLSVMDSGELDIHSNRGWDMPKSRQQLEDSKESPLVQRALRDGLRGNGYRPEEPRQLFGPLLVAPITGRGSVVETVLCLDDIPIEDLEEETISLFFGIADWISACLCRIENGQKPHDFRLSIAYAASVSKRMGTAEELAQRIRIEDGRKEQFGIEASVIAVQALNSGPTFKNIIAGLDSFFVEHFAADLRPSDGFYSFIHPGCYVIVLAGTNRVEANLVRKRLLQRARNLCSYKVEMIEFTTSGHSKKYPTLAKLMVRITQLFHAHSSIPIVRDASLIIPDKNRLGNLQDFDKRVRAEWSLALRNGIDFYVIDIKCADCSEEEGERIAHHVHQVCHSLLRPTDSVYRTGRDLCSLILPGISCEQAFVVLADTMNALNARLPEDLTSRLIGDVFAVEAGSEEYRKIQQTLKETAVHQE